VSGSPRRRTRAPDRYGALLLLILADCVVFFSTGREGIGKWVPAAMMGATVIFGLRTSRVGGWIAHVARVLTGILLVGVALSVAIGSSRLGGWSSIVGALAVATLTIGVLWRVLRHEYVTVQTIFGAICVYVLFGLVFAFLEYGINNATGNPFFAQSAAPNLANHLYFSFVVLTTLGFGDLTPATNVGKALVSFEALLGQVFLVTLVARLVSLYGTEPVPPS
jgi:hypothetical protein